MTERTADPEILFETQREFAAWLSKNHGSASGVLLVLGKSGGKVRSLTYAEAVEVALTWGWIDAKKSARDAHTWLQRFTPRTSKSPWSKINREKATALIEAGKMKAPGLAEVERAKRDGRWKAAYDSPSAAKVPPDLALALEQKPRARKFFDELDAANRYAILHRLMTAKKPETRAERLSRFVTMLSKGETIHPPRKKRAAR
jgi:uncharacterized protein YdeI (YjbR/CyaY-like superfamily)